MHSAPADEERRNYDPRKLTMAVLLAHIQHEIKAPDISTATYDPVIMRLIVSPLALFDAFLAGLGRAVVFVNLQMHAAVKEWTVAVICRAGGSAVDIAEVVPYHTVPRPCKTVFQLC